MVSRDSSDGNIGDGIDSSELVGGSIGTVGTVGTV